jgi:hypothetical protein
MPAVESDFGQVRKHSPTPQHTAAFLRFVPARLPPAFVPAPVQVNINTNATNCGACGTACTTGANGQPATCSGGTCSALTCLDGFADCNGISADGCEVRRALPCFLGCSCWQCCIVMHACMRCGLDRGAFGMAGVHGAAVQGSTRPDPLNMVVKLGIPP